MKELFDFEGIKHKCITQVDTQLGYLQVLEYILQDYSFVHIVQWHLNNDTEENTLIPKVHAKSFYQEKDKALKFAHEIGNNLLIQYDIP